MTEALMGKGLPHGHMWLALRLLEKGSPQSSDPTQGSQAGLLGRAGPEGARLSFLFSRNVCLDAAEHLQHPRKSCRAKSCNFMFMSEHK